MIIGNAQASRNNDLYYIIIIYTESIPSLLNRSPPPAPSYPPCRTGRYREYILFWRRLSSSHAHPPAEGVDTTTTPTTLTERRLCINIILIMYKTIQYIIFNYWRLQPMPQRRFRNVITFARRLRFPILFTQRRGRLSLNKPSECASRSRNYCANQKTSNSVQRSAAVYLYNIICIFHSSTTEQKRLVTTIIIIIIVKGDFAFDFVFRMIGV